MKKREKISLAAFMRSNGVWAIATRLDKNDSPKIFSANYAKAIAWVLRGHELDKPNRIIGYYVSWFRDNFSEALIPDIADQLESLAALVDRENGTKNPWMLRGEVIYGDQGTKKLH